MVQTASNTEEYKRIYGFFWLLSDSFNSQQSQVEIAKLNVINKDA